jgi:uncharacterized protein YjbI with pentapeptide repeats
LAVSGRLPAAAAALILVALAAPHGAGAAVKCPRHAMRAVAIRRRLAAGRAVSISNRYVSGTLRMPAEVRAPLTFHRVTFCGPLLASATSFDKLVDLRGSRFWVRADFSDTTFNGPAVLTGIRTRAAAPLLIDFATFRGLAFFGGAIVRGPAIFADTEFDSVTRFSGTHFSSPASFATTWFGDIADFSTASFGRKADFSGAEFRSSADFSSARFRGKAIFAAARFTQPVDFSASQFVGLVKQHLTLFRAAHFDAGGSFLDAIFAGPVSFTLAQSGGDIVFDGTNFMGDANFQLSRLLGASTFAQAQIGGVVNLDQAVVRDLDLDGAAFVGPGPAVILPQPTATTGRVDDLRFDPNDVSHIGIGSGVVSDTQREHALALLEAAALRGGDAKAANEAQLRRWQLMRSHREVVLMAGDWLVLWGIGGYLVAPFQQVAALLGLMLAATTIRVFSPRFGGKPRARAWRSFKTSLGALWRFSVPTDSTSGWLVLEALAYKLIVLVFLVNLANVWPLGHDLVKGVLP